MSLGDEENGRQWCGRFDHQLSIPIGRPPFYSLFLLCIFIFPSFHSSILFSFGRFFSRLFGRNTQRERPSPLSSWRIRQHAAFVFCYFLAFFFGVLRSQQVSGWPQSTLPRPALKSILVMSQQTIIDDTGKNYVALFSSTIDYLSVDRQQRSSPFPESFSRQSSFDWKIQYSIAMARETVDTR